MPETIKIEKNIPLPSIVQRSQCMYPFDEMGIGDSFFVGPDPLRVQSVRNSLNTWLNRNGPVKYRFTVRRTVGGGYRCWRLALR